MTLTVIVNRDGTINFSVEQGDFSAASLEIQKAVAGLKLEGIEFAEIGEIEKHRHDSERPAERVTAR